MNLPSSRLLASLDADVARFRVVAAQDLTAPVPTCPAWVVEDLVRHVANGLRNVALRRVLDQDPILEPDKAEPDPLGAVERAHADLVAELGTRPLDELAARPLEDGYTPAETAYFWLRRMTHEIAVHRADAEWAQHEAVTAVPPDLAVDGITEMLDLFLRYGTHVNPDAYTDLLTDWGDNWVLLTAGDGRWRITVTPTGVDTASADESSADDSAAPATVRGEPMALLLWLYNRSDDVTRTGDPALTAQLRVLLDRVMT